MSKYRKIITDNGKNTPISATIKLDTEQYYDLTHHTHKMSDLINDVESEETVSYDDTQIREDFNNALSDLYNKVMGITDEDSTTVDEAYNTLKEVSKYIKEDGEAAAEMLDTIAAIEEALTSKVNTEEGKSLVPDTEIERLAKVDNYDDSEIKEAIESKVSYNKETAEADFVADHYIDTRCEPYFDATLNYFFANGFPVIIEQDPDDTTAVIAKWGFNKSTKIPNSSTVKIIGGGDGFITTKSYPHTKITVNSGNIKAAYGGCLLSGIVDVAEIIVNGGIINGIDCGPMSYDDARSTMKPSVVYNSNLVINNGSITVVYGGGYGEHSVTELSTVTVNGGSMQWLTAGCANGVARECFVEINGGTIKTYQSCNRGSVGTARVSLNDGTITNFYCGGEAADDVSGTIEEFECTISGGTITNFLAGTDGSTAKATGVDYVERAMSLDKISGTVTDGVITNISDELSIKLQ